MSHSLSNYKKEKPAMSKLVIRLADDGKVYRDDKHIATVKDGEVKFKHYSYKKHRDEIDLLLKGEEDEPEVETGEEPATPLELFNTAAGKWYGEEAPEVVLWRKDNWSWKAFEAKYQHQVELLCNNFANEGLTFDINFNQD